MKGNNNVTVSFPIGNILFVVFLVLKLTHVINWSWWWVTAPLWIPFSIVVVVYLIWAISYFFTSK